MRARIADDELLTEQMIKLYDIVNIKKIVPDAERLLVNLCVLPLDNDNAKLHVSVLNEWLGYDDYSTLEALNEYGWLSIGDDDTITMDSVISEVLRMQLLPDTDKCGKIIDALTSKINKENHELHLVDMAHVFHAERIVSCIHEENLKFSLLFNALGNVYRYRGEYEKARRY